MSIWKLVGVCLLWPSLAFAETSPAEQAAQMLARVQSVDVHCNYLNASDKDELSKLVARAELALANRESVEATTATMQRGHAEGSAAACSANEKEALNMILGAARAAAGKSIVETKAGTTAATPQAQPDAAAVPVVQVKSQPPVMPVQPPPKPPAPAKVAAAPAPKTRQIQTLKVPSGSMGEYARLTQAYFRARRCGGQDPHQVGQMYQNIVAFHSQLMRNHTTHEVAGVLQSSEAKAWSVNCS